MADVTGRGIMGVIVLLIILIAANAIYFKFVAPRIT